MRKYAIAISLALATSLALTACDNTGDEPVADAEVMAPAVAVPAADADKSQWRAYIIDVVQRNLEGVTSRRPFVYFIPAGDADEDIADRINQLDNVQTVVARTVLPGNMLAFGGPDSSITAEFVIDAFADAGVGSFNDVVVLVIGDPADEEQVREALDASDAKVRFVSMR